MRRLYEIIKAIDKEKLFNKVKEVFFVKKDQEVLYRDWFEAIYKIVDYPQFSNKLICIESGADEYCIGVFWNYSRNLKKAYSNDTKINNKYILEWICIRELMGMRVYEEYAEDVSDEALVAYILYWNSSVQFAENKDEERIYVEYETMMAKHTMETIYGNMIQ